MPDRGLAAAAGLAGALGVIAAALAAHGGEPGGALLETAARFLLVHAPALLVLALVPAPWRPVARIAGWLLAGGLVLFAGDLALRAAAGHGLFAYAAPLGGMLLVLGWIAVALMALTGRGSARD